MSKQFGKKLAAAGAASVAALLMATPAMAGRCGHSYPVDAPTTLAKVARACNVSLSAMKEANTGVDPEYVRPGEHLAVPDEIASATDVPAGGADLGVDGGYSSPIYRYAEYSEPAAPKKAAADQPVYVASSNDPYFIQASYGAAYVPEDPNLSYQQRSAARIRNAGRPATPVMLSPMRSYAPSAVEISANTDLITGDPLSPLMECAVLRRQPNGKIKQVREFKPMPEGRETPSHCVEITHASMAAPAKGADRISSSDFLRSEYETYAPGASFTVLKGYVSYADADCVTLRSDDGMVWRVAVPLAPSEMLGKEATIWAEQTEAPLCGGLVMNRAVYAEHAN
ncbi:hypothetical protein [Hyphococcus sp.]|uniref:hypothetical protein n=1 Tax=Hyphococcus sp. TaxID=2038636 RepID=UPI003D0DE88C